MTWNTDMTAAPRGEEKTTTITVDGKDRTKREYHVAPVWLAWADGKVARSYWVPEKKSDPAHWSGAQPTEAPIAWQHFVVPEHPFNMRDGANEVPAQDGKGTGLGESLSGKPDAARPASVDAQPNGRGSAGQAEESVVTVVGPESGTVINHSGQATHFHLEDCGSGA